ncbi:MAG: GTP-binding protein [Candidatus Heimdallarchaeum aukensis]|uniref:GTP-binding protein n=1 Tax=Candidatus Heimdallarchaeum aukensis TaxID=2876573 RepID=A0A9Y1FM76_9ARCH|nr:MAG: GTP-binding protein [Candidatus Heimdallarchaeum aukensis]
MTEKQFIFKIVLIGDGAVGKTSIRMQYMGYGFNTSHLMTLGADFSSIDKEIIPNEKWKFQIWDLAGQQMFEQVRARFYKGAQGALLVFDITRPSSFQNLPMWLNELYKFNGSGVVPVVVLANKSDLRDRKSVKFKHVEKYVSELNLRTQRYGVTNYCLETSAKTGLNIDRAFEILGRSIRDKSSKKT